MRRTRSNLLFLYKYSPNMENIYENNYPKLDPIPDAHIYVLSKSKRVMHTNFVFWMITIILQHPLIMVSSPVGFITLRMFWYSDGKSPCLIKTTCGCRLGIHLLLHRLYLPVAATTWGNILKPHVVLYHVIMHEM